MCGKFHTFWQCSVARKQQRRTEHEKNMKFVAFSVAVWPGVCCTKECLVWPQPFTMHMWRLRAFALHPRAMAPSMPCDAFSYPKFIWRAKHSSPSSEKWRTMSFVPSSVVTTMKWISTRITLARFTCHLSLFRSAFSTWSIDRQTGSTNLRHSVVMETFGAIECQSKAIKSTSCTTIRTSSVAYTQKCNNINNQLIIIPWQNWCQPHNELCGGDFDDRENSLRATHRTHTHTAAQFLLQSVRSRRHLHLRRRHRLRRTKFASTRTHKNTLIILWRS